MYPDFVQLWLDGQSHSAQIREDPASSYRKSSLERRLVAHPNKILLSKKIRWRILGLDPPLEKGGARRNPLAETRGAGGRARLGVWSELLFQLTRWDYTGAMGSRNPLPLPSVGKKIISQGSDNGNDDNGHSPKKSPESRVPVPTLPQQISFTRGSKPFLNNRGSHFRDDLTCPTGMTNGPSAQAEAHSPSDVPRNQWGEDAMEKK